jgi:hypothetical protein
MHLTPLHHDTRPHMHARTHAHAPPPPRRQLYHLRHARDYEELGLPMGASKIDIKKAYKCVLRVWMVCLAASGHTPAATTCQLAWQCVCHSGAAPP